MDAEPSTRPSLVVRLRDLGDERAWSEFTEIYGPLVHRAARRQGLQEADAQDLVQEVFRAVARAIERYDPDPHRGSFRGWLFRIARNLIINLLAAQRRNPRGTGDTDVQRLLEQCPDPSGEDSALFEAEYHSRLIAWAIERIRGDFSEVAWRAFWQSSVEGRPAKEVAETLGISLGTVYQYKSRIVVRIRHELAQFEWESIGELSEVTQWYRNCSEAIAANPGSGRSSRTT
jgi:RNA polymerase sigma-70 factor (ECF subfamily)